MSLHHPAPISHHPGEELLLAYAGGGADEAVSLIVAAHLAYCAACRRRSRELGALDAALLKLDGIKPFERPARQASGDCTPSVLRPYIGGDLRDVRWRQVGPNLSYVPLFRRGAISARLLRGVPGSETGAHRHAGL